jgi:uncharacterized membrane protein YfcA
MRLSHFILQNIEPILQRWEEFARSLAPGRLIRLVNAAPHTSTGRSGSRVFFAHGTGVGVGTAAGAGILKRISQRVVHRAVLLLALGIYTIFKPICR